jgi:hypothetical protein
MTMVARCVTQVVELLSSKFEVVSSNPNITNMLWYHQDVNEEHYRLEFAQCGWRSQVRKYVDNQH